MKYIILHLFLLQIISFLYCAVFLFLFQYMSETQDLTINYDFIKNVSSSTDINEAASILQKITFDIFMFCSGLVTEVYEHSFYDV